MKKPHREHERLIRSLIFGLSLSLAIPCSFSLAQAAVGGCVLTFEADIGKG